MEKLMRVLSRCISWLTYDGLLHYTVSLTLMVILEVFLGIEIAFIITFGLGLWRELYDKKRKGYFEWHDFICDLIGVGIPVVLHLFKLSIFFIIK